MEGTLTYGLNNVKDDKQADIEQLQEEVDQLRSIMNQMRMSNDLTNQPNKSAHSARESLISMISKVRGSSTNANDIKNLNAEDRTSIAS